MGVGGDAWPEASAETGHTAACSRTKTSSVLGRDDKTPAASVVLRIGQGVLQGALSGRALTASGLWEYPDDQPPREGWWHVRHSQRVDARVEAACDPYWRPQVCHIGSLQPLLEVGKERLVRVFSAAAFIPVYVAPRHRCRRCAVTAPCRIPGSLCVTIGAASPCGRRRASTGRWRSAAASQGRGRF